MSDFIVKGDFTSYGAASVAAGTDFAHVHFDLSNAPGVRIYNMELSAFADLVDDPNLLLGTLRIFRNILINPDINLGVQLGTQGVTTFWEARTLRNGDHNLSRVFSDPVQLDPGFRYSVVGSFGYSAALATTASVDLFVSGRVMGGAEDALYFGRTR